MLARKMKGLQAHVTCSDVASSLSPAPGTDPGEFDAMRQKLGALEKELVRLRRDRREMEKFLLTKISARGERE